MNLLDAAKLKIIVTGTRGKSSLVRALHNAFYTNGYGTLSRETGFIPIVYFNNKHIFLKREEEIPISRLLETKTVLDLFHQHHPDVVILENHAIRSDNSCQLNEFIQPDIVIITTITPDHILDQGLTLKDTAQFFLECTPRNSHIIFWTNHATEFDAFQNVCLKPKHRGVQLLFSTYEERDAIITQSIRSFARTKGIKIRSGNSRGAIASSSFDELATQASSSATIVNLGHINDPIHTHMQFQRYASKLKNHKKYLLLNFRADRQERTFLFMDAFIPLICNQIKGIIIHSDDHSLPWWYIVSRIHKHLGPYSHNVRLWKCDSFSDLEHNIFPELLAPSTIVMVGNTTNQFGCELINSLKLFRETYPILEGHQLALTRPPIFALPKKMITYSARALNNTARALKTIARFPMVHPFHYNLMITKGMRVVSTTRTMAHQLPPKEKLAIDPDSD